MLANLYGQDREEALAVIDNDAEFDKWMEGYREQRRAEAAALAKSQGKGRAARGLSKEEYLRSFAKVHGGEE